MVPGRAGNRHYARTIMADPGECATTTAVALTPPFGSQEEAAPVTPEKAKPPRLAEPRGIKPFGDRIRPKEEVGCHPLPACEARPAIAQRPTNVSGHGLCAGRIRIRSARASLPRWAHEFDAKATSTGSTSRSCTTEAVAAQHLMTKQIVPPSPGGAPSCVASWRCAWPPSRGKRLLVPAARAAARPCAGCARVAQKWSGALAVRDGRQTDRRFIRGRSRTHYAILSRRFAGLRVVL